MAAEILVVDDEADIRDLVGGILQDEGYTVRTAGNSADALAAVRTRQHWGQFPIEQDLGKVNARALIIWGAEDALIPLAAGRTMNSLIKDSKLVIIEKCGHIPEEEMPERVFEEMMNFIGK